jgi:hypothetical protein
MEQPPAPPPMEINDSFERTPVGQPLRRAHVQVEARGDSIAVTDQVACHGRRSLQVTDAAKLSKAFNPHFYFTPKYHEGEAHMAFDLRIEPGVVMRLEWRDSGKPYRTGPAILVSGSALLVGNKKLIELKSDAWCHIDLRAKLGKQADGLWTLGVTLPGQPERRFADLKCASSGWQSLDWCGFSSFADAPKSYYLDDLELETVP